MAKTNHRATNKRHSRRSKSLIKKADELSQLCGAGVYVVIQRYWTKRYTVYSPSQDSSWPPPLSEILTTYPFLFSSTRSSNSLIQSISYPPPVMERLDCSSDATSEPAPPENDIIGKPRPVMYAQFVLNLGPNGKAGVHGIPKRPNRRSTLFVLPPPPKLDLLDRERLGCNRKTSTAPVAMRAPHLLPLYGL